MARLGLVYGAIDMTVTPAGEQVILEVNPNWQFDFVAKLAGLPIYTTRSSKQANTTSFGHSQGDVSSCSSHRLGWQLRSPPGLRLAEKESYSHSLIPNVD